jgi:hypothetical protein
VSTNGIIARAKVLQLKTEAIAHVVIRNRAGKKLFDIYLPGVSVTLAVPSDAQIRIDATPVETVYKTTGGNEE